MDLFVASSLGFLQLRRVAALLWAPQVVAHFEQDAAGEDAPLSPHAFVNLYCNAKLQTPETEWWPKLVEDVVRANPHCYSPLELVDWFGQLQTATMSIWRNLVRIAKSTTSIGATRYVREVVFMTDDGSVALDWVLRDGETNPCSGNRPIVILLHGIVGDSQSEYLYHYTQQLVSAGYQPVVMVARGCGGLPLTSPSLFAGTIAFDLYECVHLLQARFGPARKIFAIGYSLGAASLLTYVSLCKGRRPSGLTAAICVSPPWCFRQTAMEPSLVGTLWSMLIVVPLKLHYLLHARELRRQSAEYRTISLLDVLLARTVGSFDRICHHAYHKLDRSSITLPVTGADAWIERGQRRYHSVEDYYRDTSPALMVGDVDTPTLALSAVDDPLCPHEFCPATAAFSAQLVVAKTRFGGHLAFPDGRLWLGAWTDRIALDILDRLR